MSKPAQEPTISKPNAAAVKFTIAPLNAHTWIVAHSRALLPGAVLRTRKAALEYVLALAKAASFSNVQIEFGDRRGLRMGGPI
jgi:hypothetical protein